MGVKLGMDNLIPDKDCQNSKRLSAEEKHALLLSVPDDRFIAKSEMNHKESIAYLILINV